ncbi:MAG: DMT family transporter, partial [Cyclobacteriaceae bacterium]|nr:DMT family transporter [Cyclobacteriaceae bacterium]
IFPLDIRQDILLSNWKPLLLLGVFTTAVGHTLFVGSFRYFSITTVSLLSNLTPVFGILIGIFFLGEIPQSNILMGGALIMGTTLAEGYRSVKKSKRSDR